MLDKVLLEKHASKLYKGFRKQCTRQQNKPSVVKLKLKMAINLPSNFKGSYKHFIKVHNSTWNGMNLKELTNSLYPLKRYNEMYTKFRKDKEGKVSLSNYGKKVLKNKRLKKGLPHEND